MLDPEYFYRLVQSNGISFFAGVPDSLLKNLCAYITTHAGDNRHIITANEGGAVALAAGHYLASQSPSLVYMQNSGLGNAINPLVSLADPEVYGIPILLVIGWRGEPEAGHDEPQHVQQGNITLSTLETMQIPHEILPRDASDAGEVVENLFVTMREREGPVALVVRRGTFAPFSLKEQPTRVQSGWMKREEVIKRLLERIPPDSAIVSTTGKTSRELFELRQTSEFNNNVIQDFLTVGSMGHASQIALGIALERPERSVVCIDGDGAALMHLGGVTSVGHRKPSNFLHILLNNGAHESVGCQPTVGLEISFPLIAKAAGYRHVFSVSSPEEFDRSLKQASALQGPVFLEVKIRAGSRADLGRPTRTPIENKQGLMRFLKGLKE